MLYNKTNTGSEVTHMLTVKLNYWSAAHVESPKFLRLQCQHVSKSPSDGQMLGKVIRWRCCTMYLTEEGLEGCENLHAFWIQPNLLSGFSQSSSHFISIALILLAPRKGNFTCKRQQEQAKLDEGVTHAAAVRHNRQFAARSGPRHHFSEVHSTCLRT